MTKQILLNTTYIDLWDMILSCTTFELYAKVNNIRYYEAKNLKDKCMLIVKTQFFIFDDFTWRNFKDYPSHHKIHSPKSHKRWIPSQIHTYMFSSYPPVHSNICWPKFRSSIKWVRQEVHKCLILHVFPHI